MNIQVTCPKGGMEGDSMTSPSSSVHEDTVSSPTGFLLSAAASPPVSVQSSNINSKKWHELD